MKKTLKTLLILCAHSFLCFIHVLPQNSNIGGFNVYYGDLHNHCNFSDGTGSVSDAYRFARDTAGYDFFSLSDHGELLSKSEWEAMKVTADLFNHDNDFVAFHGFEWSSVIYGHVNVIGSEKYCSFLGLLTFTFSGFINWLNSCECIAFFNHPGYLAASENEFDHFEITPTEKIVGMELWNENKGFDHYYENDGFFSNDNDLSYFDESLQRGWYIGAWGADDNHTANWGMNEYNVAALSWELTRNSLWDAFNARRFYSTLDRNIELSFKINGSEMGSRIHPGLYEGRIMLHDADNEKFIKVELIHNGRIKETFTLNETLPVVTFNVDAISGDYYYIRAYQEDGDEVISSPIFFNNKFPENKMPEVEITHPAENSFHPEGIVTLSADASDKDDAVERVIFYLNGEIIATDSYPPFTTEYDIDTPGVYTVSAMAFDNRKTAGWSKPLTFFVTDVTSVSYNFYNSDAYISVQNAGNNYSIRLEGSLKSEIISIADISGRIIFIKRIDVGETIGLPDDLPKGIYFAFIENQPLIKVRKIIK